MSDFTGDYEQFFTSPAGIDFLTWVQEQRKNKHDTAENEPLQAPYLAASAKAYGEILEYIENMMIPIMPSKYSRRSSGADS